MLLGRGALSLGEERGIFKNTHFSAFSGCTKVRVGSLAQQNKTQCCIQCGVYSASRGTVLSMPCTQLLNCRKEAFCPKMRLLVTAELLQPFSICISQNNPCTASLAPLLARTDLVTVASMPVPASSHSVTALHQHPLLRATEYYAAGDGRTSP